MSKRKKILILGVTGQDGSFMAKYLMEKKIPSPWSSKKICYRKFKKY